MLSIGCSLVETIEVRLSTASCVALQEETSLLMSLSDAAGNNNVWKCLCKASLVLQHPWTPCRDPLLASQFSRQISLIQQNHSTVSPQFQSKSRLSIQPIYFAYFNKIICYLFAFLLPLMTEKIMQNLFDF